MVAATAAAGASLGLLAARFSSAGRAGMGWDHLAAALGGVLAGAVVGALVGGALAFLLPVRAQLLIGGLAAAVAVVVVVAMWATRPVREERPMPARATPFAPPFMLELRVPHSAEVLARVAPAERPWPFTEAEVFTAVPELVAAGWDSGVEPCRVEPSVDEMRALVAPLRAAVAAGGDSCRTADDDVLLAFNWTLEGETGGRSLESACLSQHPELAALSAAVVHLVAKRCALPPG